MGEAVTSEASLRRATRSDRRPRRAARRTRHPVVAHATDRRSAARLRDGCADRRRWACDLDVGVDVADARRRRVDRRRDLHVRRRHRGTARGGRVARVGGAVPAARRDARPTSCTGFASAPSPRFEYVNPRSRRCSVTRPQEFYDDPAPRGRGSPTTTTWNACAQLGRGRRAPRSSRCSCACNGTTAR